MGHHHRNTPADEHKLSDIGQATLYCLFMALWLSDMFLHYSDFLTHYIPSQVRLPVGIVLLVLAVYMATIGLLTVFGKKKQTPGIIRNGVFRIVRHPIYLSELIVYIGLLVLHFSLAAACIWIAAMFFLHYISRYEEKQLLQKFGSEYEQYMKDVPMWFPRLQKKASHN